MAITAKEVNELRKMTGAGMMDCKQALIKADGDIEKAIDILREKGQKVSASRADRETSEGVVFVKTSADNTEGVLIALNCETDFVAKNDKFQSLGKAVLDLAFEKNPASVESLLLESIDGLTIAEHITELVGKIGEKLEISAYVRMSAEVVVAYVHMGSKLGVLVGLENTNGTDVTAAGKNVAMQIAAMKPMAVSKEMVDQATIDHELEIGRAQAVSEGKPEHIIDKIAQGKLNKYFQENTLLGQKFVKDSSLTVEKYLQSVSANLTVSKFERVAIGS